jgi:hypothetical protein
MIGRNVSARQGRRASGRVLIARKAAKSVVRVAVQVAAWIGKSGQQPFGVAALVGELHDFPGRIRNAGEIAVAIHRQGRTLTEGGDNGRKVAATVAPDCGNVAVTVRDGD